MTLTEDQDSNTIDKFNVSLHIMQPCIGIDLLIFHWSTILGKQSIFAQTRQTKPNSTSSEC
jgi:hypothetical protein